MFVLPLALFPLFFFDRLGFNQPQPPAQVQAPKTLSAHEISLNDRFPSDSVNSVFKFNILLNADYLAGQSFSQPQKLDFADINKPLSYAFTLNPGETFAFHDQVLAKYRGKVVKTTNSKFNSRQGFKSDGWLYGDGVCHLASLFNWTASDAGLKVEAPTNHDFRVIPAIPKQYGTAILYSYNEARNSQENLYITNTKQKPVTFLIDYQNENLKISVQEAS